MIPVKINIFIILGKIIMFDDVISPPNLTLKELLNIRSSDDLAKK